MKLYAIRDVKADAFSAVHPCATEGVAKRSFAEACFDSKTDLAKYPEDYTLYQIGEFDATSGEILGLPTPKFLCSAVEVIQSSRDARLKVEPLLPEIMKEHA